MEKEKYRKERVSDKLTRLIRLKEIDDNVFVDDDKLISEDLWNKVQKKNKQREIIDIDENDSSK